MLKEEKLNIISESINSSVTSVCKKYNISRTIFYRWLKRYELSGIEGLNDIQKNFIPKNKISPEIETTILNLVKIHPDYGPESLKYLLEELEIFISVSAVFNVFKRNTLTNKKQRLVFSKKIVTSITDSIIRLSELHSGECWIFWITDLGHLDPGKNIYAYSFLDVKSKIACTRLYQDIRSRNFEETLSAVALSVATSLNFNFSYLCFFDNNKLMVRYKNRFKSIISSILQKYDKDTKIKILGNGDDLQYINLLKNDYTNKIMIQFILILKRDNSFPGIKSLLQDYIRDYNLNNNMEYEDEFLAPIEYHNRVTNNHIILPLWAYIERKY